MPRVTLTDAEKTAQEGFKNAALASLTGEETQNILEGQVELLADLKKSTVKAMENAKKTLQDGDKLLKTIGVQLPARYSAFANIK